MKKSLCALLFILGFLVTALGQGAQSLPRRKIDPTVEKKAAVYELRCRGGTTPSSKGPVAIGFSRMSEKTTATGEVILTVLMSSRGQYERAAGLDSSGLNAGSCAWVERPLNTAEYNQQFGDVEILFDTPANSQLKQELHGEPVDRSSTAAERFPDALTIPEYMKDSTHCWSFFGVFKDGLFQTSYHKYWKNDPTVYVPKPPVDLKGTIKP